MSVRSLFLSLSLSYLIFLVLFAQEKESVCSAKGSIGGGQTSHRVGKISPVHSLKHIPVLRTNLFCKICCYLSCPSVLNVLYIALKFTPCTPNRVVNNYLGVLIRQTTAQKYLFSHYTTSANFCYNNCPSSELPIIIIIITKASEMN